MVTFLRPNKAIILLQGRYAGRKAMIVKSFDDGTRERPNGHCLLVSYQHLMATRYTLDVNLKEVVTADSLQSKDKKVITCKETKKRLEERFKTVKNRWFFTKLRF
ncbi:hypothetical protein AB3S75_031265 [Citrus x aurantiifolia]